MFSLAISVMYMCVCVITANSKQLHLLKAIKGDIYEVYRYHILFTIVWIILLLTKEGNDLYKLFCYNAFGSLFFSDCDITANKKIWTNNVKYKI